MTHPHFPPAPLIETQAALEKLVQELSQEQLIGIDTESNSLYAYHEQVCLIQISTRDTDYLVDPLALADLSPLGPLMADPAIEKVFHAAAYDIMCLKRDFDWTFANLFDTLVAVRILGWQKVGLGSVLSKEFGVKLNKRHQRDDWGRRPLPADSLRYAQMDTHYLPDLRDRLARDLQSNGYWEEAREAFSELVDLPPAEHTFDPEGYWRIGRARGLPRRTMALVRELYLLREDFARDRDQPPFKIFNDSTLVALAANAPQNVEALHKVRGMTNGQVHRYGQEILQALRRGENGKLPSPPKNNRPPRPDVLARYDALREWRRDRGVARGVESDVILSRDALWELAHQAPQTKEDLKAIGSIGPWKRRAYGEEILRVLHSVTS